MTQISAQELAQVVCPLARADAPLSSAFSGVTGIAFIAVFIGGLAVERLWRRIRYRAAAPGNCDLAWQS